MLVRIDPLERAVGKQALDEHGMIHGLSLTTTQRRLVRVCPLAKGADRLVLTSFARKKLSSEFALSVPILYSLKPLLQTRMNKTKMVIFHRDLF